MGLKELREELSYRLHTPYWMYQRATRGYSDRDLWAFDHYLLSVFAGALPNFKGQHKLLPKGNAIPRSEEELIAAGLKYDEMIDELVGVFQDWAMPIPVDGKFYLHWKAQEKRRAEALSKFAENFQTFWLGSGQTPRSVLYYLRRLW